MFQTWSKQVEIEGIWALYKGLPLFSSQNTFFSVTSSYCGFIYFRGYCSPPLKRPLFLHWKNNWLLFYSLEVYLKSDLIRGWSHYNGYYSIKSVDKQIVRCSLVLEFVVLI